MSRSTHAEPNTTTFRVRPSAIFACAREADEDGSRDGIPEARDLGTGSDRAYRVERERGARVRAWGSKEAGVFERRASGARRKNGRLRASDWSYGVESVAVSWLSESRAICGGKLVRDSFQRSRNHLASFVTARCAPARRKARRREGSSSRRARRATG
jgi:hypothetical protein